MLTYNRADYRTQDWFLIACDGDLVLKLAQDLMIGEDERGQTVLSPAREDALLRVTSENGCLTLQATAMDWTFSEEGGLSVQHLKFVEGLTLKLSFPSSTLILTPDFQAGAQTRADREIRLMPTETPALTLTRVDEPVTLIEPALLTAPVSEFSESNPAPVSAQESDNQHDLEIEEASAAALAADALTNWDHQIPDEQLQLADEQLGPADEQVPPIDALMTYEVRVARTEPEAITAEAAAKPEPNLEPEAEPEVSVTAEVGTLPSPAAQRHRPLSGLIAAATLLTPMALYLVEDHKLGVDFPLTNYLPITESSSSETTPVGRVNHSIVARAGSRPANNGARPNGSLGDSNPARGKPTLEESMQPLQAPIPTERKTSNDDALTKIDAPSTDGTQQLLIASLLAEAKAFYNAGLIVTPTQANTVSHLSQVLSIDPINEEGLRLMYLSAVTLIKEAEAAHAAGDNYLARNLAEEVLGFHPEFDDARVLLDSWTRVPDG
jgi:hypothetical protein